MCFGPNYPAKFGPNQPNLAAGAHESLQKCSAGYLSSMFWVIPCFCPSASSREHVSRIFFSISCKPFRQLGLLATRLNESVSPLLPTGGTAVGKRPRRSRSARSHTCGFSGCCSPKWHGSEFNGWCHGQARGPQATFRLNPSLERPFRAEIPRGPHSGLCGAPRRPPVDIPRLPKRVDPAMVPNTVDNFAACGSARGLGADDVEGETLPWCLYAGTSE